MSRAHNVQCQAGLLDFTLILLERPFRERQMNDPVRFRSSGESKARVAPLQGEPAVREPAGGAHTDCRWRQKSSCAQ